MMDEMQPVVLEKEGFDSQEQSKTMHLFTFSVFKVFIEGNVSKTILFERCAKFAK